MVRRRCGLPKHMMCAHQLVRECGTLLHACLRYGCVQDDPILYDEVRDWRPSALWVQARNANVAYAAAVHECKLHGNGEVTFVRTA